MEDPLQKMADIQASTVRQLRSTAGLDSDSNNSFLVYLFSYFLNFAMQVSLIKTTGFGLVQRLDLGKVSDYSSALEQSHEQGYAGVFDHFSADSPPHGAGQHSNGHSTPSTPVKQSPFPRSN